MYFLYAIKGCDSNYEVYISKYKSWYKCCSFFHALS